MKRNRHQQIHLRLYQEADAELYQWYSELPNSANRSAQVKQLLRAGLRMQTGEPTTATSSAPTTAAIDTEELLAALLPEIRAVVSAALATAEVSSALPSQDNPAATGTANTPAVEQLLANLDRDLFLEG